MLILSMRLSVTCFIPFLLNRFITLPLRLLNTVICLLIIKRFLSKPAFGISCLGFSTILSISLIVCMVVKCAFIPTPFINSFSSENNSVRFFATYSFVLCCFLCLSLLVLMCYFLLSKLLSKAIGSPLLNSSLP